MFWASMIAFAHVPFSESNSSILTHEPMPVAVDALSTGPKSMWVIGPG